MASWVAPKIAALLDDRSRLCCHAQWYLEDTAENLVHALIQAIQKRGLFALLLSDNGSQMTAAELREGLARLSICTTPRRARVRNNGKQEAWWAVLEGRLLAMLENVPNLTLDALNHATQAWVEMEYNLAQVRADLVAAMSPESVAASEIPLQRLAATRHLMAQMGKPSRRS